MSATELQENATVGFLHRRILRDWRNDIKVLEVTTHRKMLIGRKQTRVEIGCRSVTACEQARISLAGFVANDASDWDEPQEVRGEELPFRLDLIEPKPEGYVGSE